MIFINDLKLDIIDPIPLIHDLMMQNIYFRNILLILSNLVQVAVQVSIFYILISMKR